MEPSTGKSRAWTKSILLTMIMNQVAADLLGEAGRHPGLKAGLPVKVGCHHVTLALSVTGVQHDGVTGHLLVLHQVQDVPNLHLLAPDLRQPLPPDHGHYPLVCPLVLLVSGKQNILKFMQYFYIYRIKPLYTTWTVNDVTVSIVRL